MQQREEHSGSHSLEVLTLGIQELDRHPDLLTEIFDRRYLGVIVQRVFEPEHMAALTASLTRGLEGMPRATAPTFKGGLYGSPLVLSGEDLTGYLDDAQRFRDAIAPLFESVGGLENRFNSVLEKISGGRPVDVARTQAGRAYLPASVRVLIEGDSLPIHYENGTTRYDSMKQLVPQVDPESIMSFYIPVALPDTGGVLEVFTTDCGGEGDRIIQQLGGPERARPILAERGYVEVLPGVGDMLVFDAGRYYHLVTEVRGPNGRWTFGSFFAFSRKHDRFLYWS